MHTSADGHEIRIEKPGYAQHTVRKTRESDANARPNSQPALKTVQERAVDATVLETYLPDGSMIQTYLDHLRTKHRESQDTFRHVIKRGDLSIVAVDAEGRVSIISSNARAALNESGGRNRLDHTEKDVDYLAELARGPGQFVHSVYQAHVSAKPNKSTIKTKNCADDTVFTLKNDHTLSKHVTTVPQWDNKIAPQAQQAAKKPIGKKSKKNIAEAVPKTVGDLEIENVGGYQDPHKKYYQYPRLFVLNNDGSARELLSQP